MPVLRRSIAWLFGLYGTASLAWGAPLLLAAYEVSLRAPGVRSGDVAGPSPTFMKWLTFAFLLGSGLVMMAVGALNAGACIAYLLREKRIAMVLACIVDAIVWSLFVLFRIMTLPSSPDGPELLVAFGVAGIGPLHLLATWPFLESRAQGLDR